MKTGETIDIYDIGDIVHLGTVECLIPEGLGGGGGNFVGRCDDCPVWAERTDNKIRAIYAVLGHNDVSISKWEAEQRMAAAVPDPEPWAY